MLGLAHGGGECRTWEADRISEFKASSKIQRNTFSQSRTKQDKDWEVAPKVRDLETHVCNIHFTPANHTETT